MSRRILMLTVAAAVLVSACNNDLGADDPECVDVDTRSGVSFVMQAQSVPTAQFGPCINELRIGWSVEPGRFESGRAWFALDSDRVGTRFLEVTLEAACDIGGTSEADSGVDEVRLYQSVQHTPIDEQFAVLPVANRHARYVADLAFSLRARGFRVAVLDADQPLGQRLEQATGEGRTVLIVDDPDLENDTMSLRPAGSRDEIPGVTLDELLARFEQSPEEESYRATWYYRFRGGCITYEFDAEGPGAASLPEEIPSALGLFPLEALREGARRAGYEISSGALPLPEYVERVEALTTEMNAALDALDERYEANDPPTVGQTQTYLASRVLLRSTFLEGLTALDPPEVLREGHELGVETMGRVVVTEEDLAALGDAVETTADISVIWISPEADAWRAVDNEMVALCRAAEDAVVLTPEDLVEIGDLPWLPSETAQVVSAAFGCTPDDR